MTDTIYMFSMHQQLLVKGTWDKENNKETNTIAIML